MLYFHNILYLKYLFFFSLEHEQNMYPLFFNVNTKLMYCVIYLSIYTHGVI